MILSTSNNNYLLNKIFHIHSSGLVGYVNTNKFSCGVYIQLTSLYYTHPPTSRIFIKAPHYTGYLRTQNTISIYTTGLNITTK